MSVGYVLADTDFRRAGTMYILSIVCLGLESCLALNTWLSEGFWYNCISASQIKLVQLEEFGNSS